MPSRSSEFPWATPKAFSSTCLNKSVAVFTWTAKFAPSDCQVFHVSCGVKTWWKSSAMLSKFNSYKYEVWLVSKLELELIPGWRWNGLKTGTTLTFIWKNGSLKTCYKICINQVRNKLSYHYVLCASLHWDSHIHKNFPISINNHVIHSLRPAARCKHLWLFWLLLQWMSPEAASNDSFQKQCGMHSQCPNWPKHPGQTKCEEQLAWAQGW